jgi:dihydroxy-acid dehydratase
LEKRRGAWRKPDIQHKTPWEEIFRSMVGQMGDGACLEPATLYLDILETRGESRDNH